MARLGLGWRGSTRRRGGRCTDGALWPVSTGASCGEKSRTGYAGGTGTRFAGIRHHPISARGAVGMAKPCQSCGTAQKLPGPGQRYCQPCKEARAPSIVLLPAATGERRLRVKAAEGHKWCSRCQSEKPIAAYGKGAYCVPCTRAKGVEARLQAVYSMTEEDYQAILGVQLGKCAICGMKPRTKRLHVDHDHKTMAVRGLLCSVCNSGVLASAKDSPEILRAAAAYLEHPPAFWVREIYATEKANVKRRPRRGRGRWNAGAI